MSAPYTCTINKIYTHNLKIILHNDEGIVIENTELLENIYNEFSNKIITKHHVYDENGVDRTEIDMIVCWTRIQLTNVEKMLMGEFVTYPILSDELLYKITKFILEDAEKKIKNEMNDKNWSIMFHIFKYI